MAGSLVCPLHTFAGSDSKPWKWSREAMFQTTTPRGIRCHICPNECVLGEGDLSDCRNRKVYNGKLYTIAYGNPCVVHIDPMEKKPLYHFFPSSQIFSIATAGCNMACLNCQNWTISQSSPTETRNYDLMPDKVVLKTIENNCKSIAYTYSEPVTFYEYVYDTSYLARQAGIKNVIVSNGFINRAPLNKLSTVIDAANIDLKSMDDSVYLRLTAGKLQPVLDTLKTLKENGIWLEITNLVVPSWTDDSDMIKRMCNWLANNGFSNTPLHFSRFHPQYKLQRLPATPLQTLENARKIALTEGLEYVYIGNVPGNDFSDTFCPECSKLIISRSGFRIMDRQIEDGKCRYCGNEIPGVWN